MEKIVVNLKNDQLTVGIRAHMLTIVFSSIPYTELITTEIPVTGRKTGEIIDTFETEDESIIIFIYNNQIVYYKTDGSMEELIKKLIKIRTKTISLGLTKKHISIFMVAFITNPYHIKHDAITFDIGDHHHVDAKLKEVTTMPRIFTMFKYLKMYRIKTKKFLDDETDINNAVMFTMHINNNVINYKIGNRTKHLKKVPKLYYAPIISTFSRDYALHFRRNSKGSFVFVKRKKQAIEYTLRFRILENAFVSVFFYYIGKIYSKLRKKPVNLYYEKYSAKVEEGTYDLFLLAKTSKTSKNYFVIEESSSDYETIKNETNIVRKHSLKAYWLIYSCNSFISTEAPLHLNVLQSNNRHFRLACLNKNFIFLQHGITYLKYHGANSTYGKNKEGEPTYIVVDSLKEKDVVKNMLNLSDESIINTGLPIFSKIDYNHINDKSKDIVTIMLTWKPYEEYLSDYEQSDYHANVTKIVEVLSKYVSKKNILIVPHPKIKYRLLKTNLKDQICDLAVSEVLSKSKLLITDYSSVVYNSFYQGGAVVFYQPDLELYERKNGPLIPCDHEYIGYRTYDIKELDKVLKQGIKNKHIDLTKFRTKEHIRRYSKINEFTDGKNIERLFNDLKNKKII